MRKHIRRGAFVLDVGGGDSPHRRVDVVCDKYVASNVHRGGRPIRRDRPVVAGDIEHLPFRDKAFDYVICSMVIEHVNNPAQALDELSRVARAGTLATQTELFEYLTPYPEHKWVSAKRDGKLVLKPKDQSHDAGIQLFGGLFWHLHDVNDFKRVMLNHPNLFITEIEWEGEIDYEIVAAGTRLYDYHSPQVLADLARYVPADDLWDGIKRFLRIHLSGERVGQLNRAYSRARRNL